MSKKIRTDKCHDLFICFCTVFNSFEQFFFLLFVPFCINKRSCQLFIAILVNNAFKTVQQSAKDKEDICRRADARQRYLTQDFTL